MQLQDLKPSLTELSTSELIDLIKDIRQARRTNRSARAAGKTLKEKEDKLVKSLQDMTLDQLGELKRILLKEKVEEKHDESSTDVS